MRNLLSHLENHGFIQNEYNKCTFNKIINGEQLTVQFHANDLKASHQDTKVLDEFLEDLQKEFGKEDELTETKGKVHEYLGMTIDYSLTNKVVFTMYDFIEDIIVEAPADLKKSKSKYPGNDKLFHVDENSKLLNNDQKELLHGLIARLLFACKRARPDIQVCVTFLCTRVTKPTEEDYAKLGRVILCLSETIDLPLVLGSDSSGKIVWNIDASYAVHPDCRSHTGASMTLGHGSVLSMSCKQKVNTKSSTEAKVVGVDDAMTFVMWMQHFFQAQVKNIPKSSILKPLGNDITIKQDNTSAIQLEHHGWGSSSKWTKHINVRYLVYKPTEMMESDFLMKALQGKLFHIHRATLMGLDGIDTYQFYKRYKQGQGDAT